MANRRMFSKTIVDSDDFLDMPVSARLLYYDLGMRADDDGFVNPKRVMRLTGASDDDLKVLLAKKYVLAFENKVLVIRDWKVNNFIRPDRYTPTIYQEYLKKLQIQNTSQYKLICGIPDDIPKGDPVKDSKGKDSKGKVRIDNTPQNLSKQFFNKEKSFNTLLDEFSKSLNIPREKLKEEFNHFVLYWTEPNKSGSKVRWELERTFDVKRRLYTWLRNTQKFNSRQNKEKEIIG